MSEIDNSISAEPFERTDEVKATLENMLRERRAVSQVRRFMMNSKKYREPHIKLALKARELYENWQYSGKSLINRANLRLPFGYTVIETLVPKLTDVFLSDDEILKVEGENMQSAQFEEVLTDYANIQLKNMQFSSKFIASLKGMLLDGTMIAKVPYKFSEKLVQQRVQELDPLTGEMVRTKKEVLEIDYNGPSYMPVAIEDFYPDWSIKEAGEIQSMRGCVHRMYKTFASLKKLEKKGDRGIYKNLDQLKTSLMSKGSGGTTAWQPPYYSDEFKQRFDRLNDNKQDIKDANKIEIWEYWGLWDPKGDGKFKEYVITLANGDVLIREQENFYDKQFKPFIACPNIIRDNEFYGIPELIAVRPLIKEADALRNARLDNVNISANPMWKVDRAAGINIQNLYSRPNGIILTNDMNGIAPVQMPDPSAGSLQESAAIQQDIQNATALVSSTPQLSQMSKTFGRSATGVNFIQSAANDRVRIKAKLISELYIQPMSKIMQMINAQFIDSDVEIKLSDPNIENPYVLFPPEAFSGNFYFKTKSDLESGGKDGELEKMQMAYQFLQTIEQSQPGTIKGDAILEALLRPIVGNRVGKFVRSDEERQQIQQQQLAAEQAVNAQIGQNAPQPNAIPGQGGQ